MNTLALLALLSPALAQSRGAVPDTNVQTWSPRLETGGLLWTNDASVPEPGYVMAGAVFSYQRGPLVYEYGDGSVVPIVSSGLQANVLGSVVIGPARLGVDMPIHLSADGDAIERTTGTGDLALDAKLRVVDDKLAPLGVALGTRLTLPTASVDAPLGDPGVGWEVSAIAHRRLGPALVALNVGNRLRPGVELENGTLGSELFARLGTEVNFSRDAGASVDLGTTFGYKAADLGVPVQGIVGAWVRPAGPVTMRLGVGTGFTSAVGSPPLRALLGVAYEPRPAVDSDEDTILDDDDACAFEPEDMDGHEDSDGCPDLDNDGDGITDDVDACPMEAEDLDAHEDSDGCPEAATLARLTFVSHDGADIPKLSAFVTVDGEEVLAGNPAELVLEPGTYPIEARAPGFAQLDAQFTVSAAEPAAYTFTLQPPETGLRITVLDPDGSEIPGAEWWTQDRGIEDVRHGAEIEMVPGPLDVFVGADGYAMMLAPVIIEEDQVTDLRLQMVPSKVEVTETRIKLKEKVFFDTNKAEIKSESFAMLEEVAAVLRGHREIVKIRIEGHTDSRGNADSNRKLSAARAEAVAAFLHERGVASERMQAVGFGEDHPLDERDTEEAWEVNRRVDIFILERADD